MSKILHLDQSYDLYITMSWLPEGNHGISGHVYEIIEYYMILKAGGIKVGILLCEDIDWLSFKSCIVTKYDITSHELSEIKRDTVFSNRPTCVRGKNILFVDGQLSRSIVRYGVILCFKNIICFRCSPHDTCHDLPYKNVTLLQDNRVYDDEDNNIAIDYVKKILFSRYHEVPSTTTDIGMLYLTSNCRQLRPEYVRQCLRANSCEHYMIVTNEPTRYSDCVADLDVDFPDMPVDDIFSKFDTYIYTPTVPKFNPHCACFDCSPRFIAECKHYGKHVVYYDIDDAYLEKDTGLKIRRRDIDRDIAHVTLTTEDDIFGILANIL